MKKVNYFRNFKILVWFFLIQMRLNYIYYIFWVLLLVGGWVGGKKFRSYTLLLLFLILLNNEVLSHYTMSNLCFILDMFQRAQILCGMLISLMVMYSYNCTSFRIQINWMWILKHFLFIFYGGYCDYLWGELVSWGGKIIDGVIILISY